jgi:NAD(P)-dependent dehydrogenase (short-subunit alcohol dehydrogenase family)
VTDALATEHALASARAANGVERVLVNCAGIAPASRIARRDGPMPLADFAHVINVNLVGSFNLLRLSACAMQSLEPLERGEHGDGESGDGERGDGERGLVVLTASIAAYEGQIGQAAYAASKAGVIGLVLPAAREFARAGIRVCAIAPGVFETPMVAAMPADVQAALGQSIPFPQRLGRPDEFAALVEHIAGNVMINGTVLRLDGAHRMSAR